MTHQSSIVSEGERESTAKLRDQELEAKNKDLDRQNLDLKFQLSRRSQEAAPVPGDTTSADIASLKAQLEAKDSMIAEASTNQDKIKGQLFLVGDAYMEAILTMNHPNAIRKREMIDKVAESLPSAAAQEWMGFWEAAKRRHDEDLTADDCVTKLQSTTGFGKTFQEEQSNLSRRRDRGSVTDSDDEANGPSQTSQSTKRLKINSEGSWTPGLGKQVENLAKEVRPQTLRSGLDQIAMVQEEEVEESSRSSTPSSNTDSDLDIFGEPIDPEDKYAWRLINDGKADETLRLKTIPVNTRDSQNNSSRQGRRGRAKDPASQEGKGKPASDVKPNTTLVEAAYQLLGKAPPSPYSSQKGKGETVSDLKPKETPAEAIRKATSNVPEIV